MPVRVMRMYAETLPKLSAQEALRGMNIAAVGGGNMEKHAMRSLVDSFEEQAGIREKKRVTSPEEIQAAAATMGFRVVS